MRTLITLQTRALVRTRPLMLLAIASLMAVAVMGSYQIWRATQVDSSLADTLSNFTRFSIAWPLVIGVLAFESMSRGRTSGMDEAVEVHEPHRHRIAATMPSVFTTLSIFVVYTTMRLVAVGLTGWRGWLASHVVAEALLNVLAPAVIGLLLGLFAALRMRRVAGYAALAIFAVLIGPYLELVPMIAQAGGFRGRRIVDLYPIYDLVRILAPDPTWSMDPLYGFPLELERWLVAGTWLAAIGTAVCRQFVRPGTGLARAARPAVAAIAAICLIGALLPSSELRRDYRLIGGSSVVSDQMYYQYQLDEHPPRNVVADFQVRAYDIRLTARNRLKARVRMALTADRHSDAYRFTLYHGYVVSKVTDARGRSINFQQEGDYLTVKSAQNSEFLVVDYEGTGGICISNAQSCFLPGYFPYYPVPGFARVWNDVDLAPIMETAGRKPSQFSIRLDGPKRAAADLPQTHDAFMGSSTAPTVIAGLVEQDVYPGMRVVSYPASGSDDLKAVNLLRRVRGIESRLCVPPEERVDATVTVFEMPQLAQGSVAALAWPGTIFVGGFDRSLAPDVVVAATPQHIERTNLREALAAYLRDPVDFALFGAKAADTGGGVGADALAKRVADLEHARLKSTTDLERAQEYVWPSKTLVYRLLGDKIDAEGESVALRDTYRYLASDSDLSELEFLAETDKEDTQP